MADPKLVLVIDDEPEFREIFSAKLVASGYRVELAIDGKEGIERAKQLKPDLILMDMQMPNMSGADALMQLKEAPETKDISVLFLSNLGDPQQEIQRINSKFAEQLGAVGYVRKTDDLDAIVERIKNALS